MRHIGDADASPEKEKNMKKLLSALIAAAALLSLASCGSSSGNSKADEPEKPYQSIETAAPVKTDDSDFAQYPSNTFVATGNNKMVPSADGVTYRAYFPVEKSGELEYKFYFSNTVDSTYSLGKDSYVGMSGGNYTIESAFISDGGTSVDDEPTNRTEVTFGGSGTKSVAPDETFFSDAVSFDVPEGHYLVWEWTLTGETIPCTSVSNLTKAAADYNDGRGWTYCDDVPLPQLIGAKREVKYRIAAIGDSITQGCQTEFMAYEFWAAQLSQKLGSEYSFWNCGLGWSRASDAAADGDWLERIASADVVIVAFGTNDIISGEHGSDGGNTAAEIDSYIRSVLDKLKEKECRVIVFNTPPEDYKPDLESVRTELNEMLTKTCEEYGVFCFDFASLLSEESDPAHALYGGHPNGEGGNIVSDTFLEQYAKFLDIN